jgi:hypothetical protein
MTRTDIINDHIQRYGYKSYLELGTDNRALNFNHIKCAKKFCVDINPASKADFIGPTDRFFELNERTWDIVFVDADHEWTQARRDIENSLGCLSEGGTVIVHDCNPTTRDMQEVPRKQGVWTGNVWKAFTYLRRRPDLEMRVINTDYGVGIIRKGSQKPLIIENPTYEQFEKNKREWLNLQSNPISICVPTYSQNGKGAKMLTQLLNSIRLQNFQDEYEIVISDNSEDEDIEKIIPYFDLPIKYFKSERRGVSANTNNALDLARFDKIKIMYQDDLFYRTDALKLFSEALDNRGWVISNSVHINESNQITYQKQTSYNHNRFDRNLTGMPSVIGFRKCDLRFNEELKTVLDMLFYYQLYEKYGSPFVIKEFTIAQRFWKGSISANQPSHHREEALYLKNNGLIKCQKL